MSTTLAILGSGFGLYGYAAAAVDLGYTIVTLRRYAAVMASRPDLAEVAKASRFVEDEAELLRCDVDGVVVARTPTQQAVLVLQRLEGAGVHWFLEKPLAVGAVRRDVIARLAQWGDSYSVGYLFPFAPWFAALARVAASSPGTCRVKVRWSLAQAAAYGSTASWKVDPTLGGGMLQYYVVHLAPILTTLGTLEVTVSEQGAGVNVVGDLQSGGRFEAIVRAGPPSFRVDVRGGSGQRASWSGVSPFAAHRDATTVDERVPVLQEYVQSALRDPFEATRQTLAYEVAVDSLLRSRTCMERS